MSLIVFRTDTIFLVFTMIIFFLPKKKKFAKESPFYPSNRGC